MDSKQILTRLYKDYTNKNLSFNINQTKTKFSFDYELQIFEQNLKNFYTL